MKYFFSNMKLQLEPNGEECGLEEFIVAFLQVFVKIIDLVEICPEQIGNRSMIISSTEFEKSTRVSRYYTNRTRRVEEMERILEKEDMNCLDHPDSCLGA